MAAEHHLTFGPFHLDLAQGRLWRGPDIPPALPASHDASQTCSFSQALNSPGVTGLRAYPSRCFCSMAWRHTWANAAPRASRVKAERVVPNGLTTWALSWTRAL
jgi:hypothetical protein